DQSVVVAAGQSGDFDRFGMMQYRNRASRTHWQVSGFHRSVVRARYDADSTATVNRNESEQGLLFSAQYHKSLVTRFGFGLSVTRRTDATGRIVARQEDTSIQQSDAPVLGLQLPRFDPRSWRLSLGGVPNLSMLTDRSPAAMAKWGEAERVATRQAETEFLPTQEYVRSNVTLGGNFSRDTRVWSDVRGPHSGALFVVSASAGVNTPGSRTDLNSAQGDSLRQHVASGLDRVSVAALFLTHRRLRFLDLAFRVRGFANDGHQALVYGLGGIYSVAGFSRGFIRSERIAYANLEARAQLWDYSAIRLPIHHLVLPAADGFLFVDAGAADGAEAIYSYGIGLRLRFGFLAWEWRRLLRAGLRNQNGLTFVW
ncbi:MAG: hypothetical protein ACE5G2_11110, partial [Candidatus Krumholzibacteriia bacterium]